MDQEFQKALQDETFKAQLETKLSECGPAPAPPKSVPQGVQGVDRGKVGAGGWAAWVPLVISIMQSVFEQWKRDQGTQAQAGGGGGGEGEGAKS